MLNYLGWRFLFGSGEMERLLWIGASDQDTLVSISHIVDELCVVHCGGTLSQKSRNALCEQGISNVRFICDSDLPFPDGYFDGIIYADVGSAGVFKPHLDTQEGLVAFGSLMAEAARVLKRDGWIYMGLRNPFSYTRIKAAFKWASNRDGDRGEGRDLTLSWLTRALGNLGFGRIDIYKLLCTNGVVEEVILGGRYHSAKNSFTIKQRVKNALLSGPFAVLFSPSLAIVATRELGHPRYLDLLLGDLVKAGALPGYHDNRITVNRFLILPGKVILSVGEAGRPYGERIVVLPLNATVLDRLRAEARTLQALHDLPLRICSKVPRFFTEGELCGQAYFVQQEMPGTSIDAPVAELPTMTSYAVSLLIDFHIQTKQEVMLDGVNFGMLVSSPLGRVVTGLGSSAEASAARIEKLAHNILYGKPFMLVWMHGDYKIENLIFDPDSLQVTGIIDWDLSQAKGYPLLDLLYLITYNRVITEHREIEEVILNCIVPQRFSEFEREISDSYVRELGLDADAMEVLIMLFCIHHIAYRREISGCDAKTVENLRIMLGAVEGLLENKYRITSLK